MSSEVAFLFSGFYSSPLLPYLCFLQAIIFLRRQPVESVPIIPLSLSLSLSLARSLSLSLYSRPRSLAPCTLNLIFLQFGELSTRRVLPTTPTASVLGREIAVLTTIRSLSRGLLGPWVFCSVFLYSARLSLGIMARHGTSTQSYQ